MSDRYQGKSDAAWRLAQRKAGCRPRKVRQVRGVLALLSGPVRRGEGSVV